MLDPHLGGLRSGIESLDDELMKALRVAWSLILIPRLFATFLLWPLLISLVVVYFQLLVTGVFSNALVSSSASVEQAIKTQQNNNLMRLILFGDGARRPPIKVCRWHETALDGQTVEVPPSDECQPDRLDIALHVADPAGYDPSVYLPIFDGNFERIHLCQHCAPDIVITPEETPVKAHVKSLWALGLLDVSRMPTGAREAHLQSIREFERVSGLVGKRILSLPGSGSEIPVSQAQSVLILVANVATLIIISLWLSLKAHRKVLDYFSRSGALLPLVAACGQQTFYGAVWILTLFRVGAFLAAAIPFMCLELVDLVRKESVQSFLGPDRLTFTLWIVCLCASLSLATVVASLADLKQRYNLLSFAYRYIPPAICIVGALVWGATFFLEGSVWDFLRSVTTVLPVVGMVPVLMAPLVKPYTWQLAAHLVTALIFIAVALRANAEWFAAHLEDV